VPPRSSTDWAEAVASQWVEADMPKEPRRVGRVGLVGPEPERAEATIGPEPERAEATIGAEPERAEATIGPR
jgi:hypothetical protein